MAYPRSGRVLRRMARDASVMLEDLLGVPRPPGGGLLRSYSLLSFLGSDTGPFEPVPLTEVQDGRVWAPEALPQPAALGLRSSRRLVVGRALAPPQAQGAAFFSPRVGFAVPGDVAVCVRRKTRREVLFAKGRTSSSVRRKRGPFSDIVC